MSICLECVVVVGFARWAWKRCTYVGSDDSDTWPSATPEEFEAIPRICRVILGCYDTDVHAPPNASLNPDFVIKRVTYTQTLGHAPPYLIYADHVNREIVLALRGLNLAKDSDYKVLLDNRLGRQMFDGGYVHHGLLKSAMWVLNRESETLKKLWVENGKCYKMIFAGHSLGSGVAALMTVIVVNHRDGIGGIPRELVRCYALAPARCMSLNMAVKYADVIHSVILQVVFNVNIDVDFVGFARWAWKRCTYVGSDDSDTWPSATPEEFEAIPRICRVILGCYDTDVHAPPNAGLNPDFVIKRVTYTQTLGHAPPYLIYADHVNREIVLALRGLNLAKDSDYKVLLDNRLGRQMFDGGYVHHGLLKSAMWVLNRESETLKKLWVENGKCYKMIFAGHSLGSGVAALMTVIVVNHRDGIGGIPRELVRCYALAPARCMSLNMAVKYADVIHSVILQDDFLPRTATPLEDIFKSLFCLPCLMFLICLRDTFIPEERKLRDPRRLYAPGRMYHIVERRFCRCGRFPPEVRTAIPVDGRFEHIVLSCNATSDHGIIWIEREAEKALQIMKECSTETLTSPPMIQKLTRLRTIENEHHDALERAVSLNVPHAVPVDDSESDSSPEPIETESEPKDGKTNWNELVEKLLKKNQS